MIPADSLQAFHHVRIHRVCVRRELVPSRGPAWAYRSELNGIWMPCLSGHPTARVIDVPIDPHNPEEGP